MKVNANKTELLLSTRLKDPTVLQKKCDGALIKISPSSKRWGVLISSENSQEKNWMRCPIKQPLHNGLNTRWHLQLLNFIRIPTPTLPFKAKFYDRSRLKIGRQALQNRIGSIFLNINFDWIKPMSLCN
jgi:hypothetical protein